MFKIYHNPRCSKSRQTLQMLQNVGQKPQIVEYLKTIPTKDELNMVIDLLKLPVEDIIRKGEEIYKKEFAGKDLTRDQWVNALIKYPILLERPIVVKDGQAVLGRPPENVLKLLK